MRLPMMADGLLPLSRVAALAVWLAATLTLAAIMGSLLPLLILPAAIVAITGARQFDGLTRRARFRIAPLWPPAHANLEDSFGKYLETEFAAAQRGRTLTLVMFGLTHLEQFREREGPEAAAAALREFGRVLQQMTRQLNRSSRCGWRADAFLVVLAEVDVAAAQVFIARVRAAVAASAVPVPHVEAGIAAYQSHLASPEELVDAAERALAAARAAAGAPRQPRHKPPLYGAPTRQLRAG